MRYCIFVSAFLLFGLASSSQPLDWKSSKDWKIYDLRGRAAMSANVDSLANIKNALLDSQVLSPFLSTVTVWPEQKSTVWMGAYLATCELADNKLRKILVSTYGGYFFDEPTGRYYQVSEESVDDWLSFFNEARKKLAKLDKTSK